ncbi:hypothetical protein DL770_004518 [Monosporascus sp. CRB-9-2]|nr:hypothetical protein DL770_004518 [Monosporascus sp. CRB-9-2]
MTVQEAPDAPKPLLLSDEEKRVLELHDRLQQLQLEIALLTAQNNYVPSTTTSSLEEGRAIKAAQKELLDSRARYVLRNETVESVVMANPIMQAVHSGANASPIERDLLPVLEQRDAASVTLAKQSAELRALLDELAEVEGRSLRLGRENADLAAEALRLAGEANRRNNGTGEPWADADPDLAAEIVELEAQVRASRKRWRVVKGTASAFVAGSGVDWARDAELRDIVLDAEDDDI